ncbi:M23 family metallopeptidase [Thalassomonas sp. RHCl1]|uniref:M23 family metallopeptidase n=1 Tax=Thalassomonas sp. RHCl1 TaxID=2995320 RepID=UPI00248D1E91|nr:M23 family metallopeptidase [Thalassomonas sp. RHCl1]
MSRKLLSVVCLGLFFTAAPVTVSAHGEDHKGHSTAQSQTRLELFGEISQGGLVVGKTSAANTVKLDDQQLQLSPEGEFVFGFGRDDSKKYRLQVISPNGSIREQYLTPAKREYNIQRIEGIKKSIMQPNPKAVARSKKDNAQIAQARKTASSLTSFAGGFIPPIKGTITGVYGSQRVFNGEPKRPHFGLDYAGDVGDPVKAPASGKVLLYVPDMFYSGGTMIIDHGQGITSTFLHLSDAYVKAGDEVKQGQVVAAVGKSGRATGPHLDWRINWFNVRLDPALALKVHPL